jgi:hypothetical protein
MARAEYLDSTACTNTVCVAAHLTVVPHDFPQSLQANSKIVPQSHYDHFLPNPFQFIIRQLRRVLPFDAMYSRYLECKAVPQLRRLVAVYPPRPLRPCGICGGQSGTGVRFLQVLRFPCQFSCHWLLHTRHNLLSGAGTIGQTVADVPSELNLTRPQETKKK